MSSLGPAMNWDAFAFAELLLTQPCISSSVAERPGLRLLPGRVRALWPCPLAAKTLADCRGASHYDLYDQPDATGQALAQIVPFFRQHLAQAHLITAAGSCRLR